MEAWGIVAGYAAVSGLVAYLMGLGGAKSHEALWCVLWPILVPVALIIYLHDLGVKYAARKAGK